MLTVVDAAKLLGVSPSRVRALISSNALPARKIGRNWVLEEEDVVRRLANRPHGGRPRSNQADAQPLPGDISLECEYGRDYLEEMRRLYLSCKEHLSVVPASELISSAESHEEASFYISVSDFFLKQRQYELIERGVF